MAPPRTEAQDRFVRQLAVETPEHVLLEFELAGVGSRAAAAIFDTLVIALLLLAVLAVAAITGALAGGVGGWLGAVLLLAGFAIAWGYYVLSEGLRGGRTLGKRDLGIRVVMDTGHPITFGASAVRNLLRIVDAQPGFTYLVGGVFVLFHPQHRRLGDLVAGTVVVRDRPADQRLTVAAPAPADDLQPAPAPALADDEYHLLDQFLARRDQLEPERRARIAGDLTVRFADRYPRRPAGPETFLIWLHAEETRRRQRPTAGRFAERFVARKLDAWERFRKLAARAERDGLARLGGAAVPGFAAGYREVAADLARARTYGVENRVREHLDRIVSAGHNALYGLSGVRRIPFGQLLLRELPRAVVQARAYVVAACMLFTLPAVAGYLLVRERPAIAAEVLPDEMLERAANGAEDRAAGTGYAQMPSPYLPLVASSIIANNVQVAFGAFAFGITAGVGTVLVLLFNGLSFGAVMGLFANDGLTGWFLTFVAAHGVLELTAIFIAGGAGLLVARALIAPGDLSRRDALVIHGRTAIRMVGAAVCLLLLAGTIEGLLSASDAPSALKLTVSVARAVLLGLYLGAGTGREPTLPVRPSVDGAGIAIYPSSRGPE